MKSSQPAVTAAGDCPQNPARRPHHAVGEQHAWRAANGAAGLSAHRPVLCQVARKSGAVGCSATLVSHPQRGAAKISARPATNPASTPPARLTPPAIVANWYANCRPAWRQLPDLGSTITWTLQNVTPFVSGQTATGSFTLDQQLREVIDWSIMVTGGTKPSLTNLNFSTTEIGCVAFCVGIFPGIDPFATGIQLDTLGFRQYYRRI